jgi:hypothetical protein
MEQSKIFSDADQSGWSEAKAFGCGSGRIAQNKVALSAFIRVHPRRIASIRAIRGRECRYS